MPTFADASANVRAINFVLIRTRARCPHCGVDTEVAALALPRGHQWRDEDSPNSWYRATAPAILFHVSQVAPAPSAAIQSRTTGFRAAASGEETLWCNYCASCQGPIDDDGLHCEPGGAFIPLGPDAAPFEMELIGTPLAATAGGYAPDPPFIPEFPA